MAKANVGTGERVVSAVGGGLLALYGWRRRPWAAVPLTLAGAALMTRAATGHSRVYERLRIDTAHPHPVMIDAAVTVEQPPEAVYRYWRQLENLPRFMRHLESVRETGPKDSHWVARIPYVGTTIEWDAEIVEARPNELLRWRSLPGSEIASAGTVTFRAAPGDRGTEVRVHLEYRAGDAATAAAARLLRPLEHEMLRQEIRRFKSVMEAGEPPTTEGQSSARGGAAPWKEAR